MPVPGSIYVFASQKGGTGKTKLCYHTACQYAHSRPDEHVMLLDMTELGDLTKRCLGGVSNEEALASNAGKMFEVIEAAEKVEEQHQRGMFMRMASVFRRKVEIDLESAAVHPSEWNAAAPENLYLMSSGASSYDEEEEYRDPEEMRTIAQHIRQALEQDPRTWKVFIDTDGDRRPAPFTRLGYALADYCIIPIAPDESDFARLLPMFKTLQGMYEREEMRCRVQFICWNKLQLYRKAPSDLGSFTTPKVTGDMIASLNKKLFEQARQCGKLFVHCDAPDAVAFQQAATVLVRDFPDTCSLPSNAMGIPFCRMSPGAIVLPSGVEFKVQREQIESCVENITELLGRLDAMEA